jgi:hypothetical protein
VARPGLGDAGAVHGQPLLRSWRAVVSEQQDLFDLPAPARILESAHAPADESVDVCGSRYPARPGRPCRAEHQFRGRAGRRCLWTPCQSARVRPSALACEAGTCGREPTGNPDPTGPGVLNASYCRHQRVLRYFRRASIPARVGAHETALARAGAGPPCGRSSYGPATRQSATSARASGVQRARPRSTASTSRGRSSRALITASTEPTLTARSMLWMPSNSAATSPSF